jgi:hypothetical protein
LISAFCRREPRDDVRYSAAADHRKTALSAFGGKADMPTT